MSEALQMADDLDRLCDPYDSVIAAELRRLHDLVEEDSILLRRRRDAIAQLSADNKALCDANERLDVKCARLETENEQLRHAMDGLTQRCVADTALIGELAKALRETTGAHELGVLLSVHGLDKARAALAKVEASK